MDVKVIQQILFLSKSPLTDGACKLLIKVVDSHVPLQAVRTSESTCAQGTCILEDIVLD